MRNKIDAHVHVTQQLLPYLRGVKCIANVQNEEQARFLRRVCTEDMTLSVGIHPWDAHGADWETMEPLLQRADVIGEIGMDSVWCSCDLAVQEEVFVRQLALARQLKKPVILHTKGAEEAVLRHISDFPNHCLVHWYSCAQWLQAYIDTGAWFTVGPSVRTDPAVRQVAVQVPIERLLPESDGLDGLSWALEREVPAAQYRDTMDALLREIARLRGCDAQMLALQMEENLKEFLRS